MAPYKLSSRVMILFIFFIQVNECILKEEHS